MEVADKEDKYHRYRYRDPGAPRNEQNVPSIWFSKRFNITVLLFLGYFMHGIICQVAGITLTTTTTDRVIIDQTNNVSIIQPSEFPWNLETKEIHLHMFWLGFLFAPQGGVVAQTIGGARTIGVSMMLTGVILALNPISAQIQHYVFGFCKMMTGVLQGYFLVGTSEVFACWMPMRERSVLVSFVINGMYVAAVVMNPFCTNLAYKWEWATNFYVLGIVCFIWSIIWLIYVKNEPLKDKRISQKEFEYIWQETGTLLRERNLRAYRDILASPSCWALFFCKFAFGSGCAFTWTYLPLSYVKDVMAKLTNAEINEVYFILLVLDIFTIFTIPIVGVLISFWLSSGDRISLITRLHKTIIAVLYMAVGFSLLIILLLVTRFPPFAICLLSIKPYLLYSQIILELIPVHMAPNHSSVLSGFAVCWQISGIVTFQTIIKGTVENHKIGDWNTCIRLSAAVLVLSAMIFWCFGTSEPQPWSAVSQSDDRDESQRGQYKELVKLSTKENVSTTRSYNIYEEQETEEPISLR